MASILLSCLEGSSGRDLILTHGWLIGDFVTTVPTIRQDGFESESGSGRLDEVGAWCALRNRCNAKIRLKLQVQAFPLGT